MANVYLHPCCNCRKFHQQSYQILFQRRIPIQLFQLHMWMFVCKLNCKMHSFWKQFDFLFNSNKEQTRKKNMLRDFTKTKNLDLTDNKPYKVIQQLKNI